jgi:hypothetical protein
VPQRLWRKVMNHDCHIAFHSRHLTIVGPASAQIGSQRGYSRDVPCYIMIIPSGG